MNANYPIPPAVKPSELLQDGLLVMKNLVDNIGKSGELEAILRASIWTVVVTRYLKEL